MGTARSAFSIRDGLRRVLRPSPDEIPSVAGLRALSILWVLWQHYHQGLRPLMLLPEGAAFLSQPLLRLGWAGNLGVDVFFVISGYLIGGMLMREREESGGLALGRFYGRRAMRILPAYFAAIALNVAVGTPNPSRAWANVIFVNDFLPFADQFMAHTWSLAIEEQFYALFPLFVLLVWALRPSLRTALVAFAIALFAAIGVVVVLRHRLVLSERFPDMGEFMRYMDLFYVRPYTRCAALFAGVLVARLEQTSALSWLDRRPVASVAMFLAALSACAWVIVVFPEGYDARGNRTLSGALALALDGAVFAFGVGALLALARTRSPIGRIIASILGARALHPIAQLSYAAYLFHPLCIAPVLRLGFDVGRPWLSYPILLGLSLIATFAAALVVHLLVELPMMKLRPPRRALSTT